MYKSIVVGYDESLSSKAALKEVALRVKGGTGAVYLVHAVYFDQEEFAILPSQIEKRLELGTHVCIEAKKNLQTEYGLNGNVESIICEGEPPEVITDIAQQEQASGRYMVNFTEAPHGQRDVQVIVDAPVMCS